MLHVTSVKYIQDYSLYLSFDDGTRGNIDLYQHLKGLMFEPLKDKNFFKKVMLDAELQTITWSNGADFAPEFLKDHLEND
ncbi:DUF2442 domain-containing protein [Rickettsia endosymbiont of Halotydeus destructor]|uniref:DUF2442 domain-containing protein n=1 Tax=Rickettsia endosymbiont of Halotydeus destructor TaxID=2996754 RepID=UPI003BB102A2